MILLGAAIGAATFERPVKVTEILQRVGPD
jgi:hypothetical protein